MKFLTSVKTIVALASKTELQGFRQSPLHCQTDKLKTSKLLFRTKHITEIHITNLLFTENRCYWLFLFLQSIFTTTFTDHTKSSFQKWMWLDKCWFLKTCCCVFLKTWNFELQDFSQSWTIPEVWCFAVHLLLTNEFPHKDKKKTEEKSCWFDPDQCWVALGS